MDHRRRQHHLHRRWSGHGTHTTPGGKCRRHRGSLHPVRDRIARVHTGWRVDRDAAKRQHRRLDIPHDRLVGDHECSRLRVRHPSAARRRRQPCTRRSRSMVLIFGLTVDDLALRTSPPLLPHRQSAFKTMALGELAVHRVAPEWDRLVDSRVVRAKGKPFSSARSTRSKASVSAAFWEGSPMRRRPSRSSVDWLRWSSVSFALKASSAFS